MAGLCGRAIPFCSGMGRRETKRKDLGPTIPFEHMPPVVCRAPNRPPPGGQLGDTKDLMTALSRSVTPQCVPAIPL